MKKEEKKKKDNTPKKKSKKVGFIIGIIFGVGAVATIFFFEKDSKNIDEKSKNKVVSKEIKSESKEDKIDLEIIAQDSIVLVDSVQLNDQETVIDDITIQEEENKSARPKVRLPKIDNENNPNNWLLKKNSSYDTTFFIIYNRVTGTKLSNRYYSKDNAEAELKSFKKIISK